MKSFPLWRLLGVILTAPGATRGAEEPPASIVVPIAAAPDVMLPLAEALEQPARPMTFEKAPLATIFYTLGKAYRINICVDPRITGTALPA